MNRPDGDCQTRSQTRLSARCRRGRIRGCCGHLRFFAAFCRPPHEQAGVRVCRGDVLCKLLIDTIKISIFMQWIGGSRPSGPIKEGKKGRDASKPFCHLALQLPPGGNRSGYFCARCTGSTAAMEKLAVRMDRISLTLLVEVGWQFCRASVPCRGPVGGASGSHGFHHC